MKDGWSLLVEYLNWSSFWSVQNFKLNNNFDFWIASNQLKKILVLLEVLEEDPGVTDKP